MEGDQVPNRALLQQRFERYEALAEALCRRTDLPETVRRLERLRARLRQGPVRLLVVGVSCSGKSTLINALAGEFVAPEGDYVTSCVPLWVSGRKPDSKGPRFQALYWGRDGSFYLNNTNQADALGKLCHVPGHKAQVPEGLEAMTARVSGGFLWDSGLTLVDTPGIGQQTADDTQTRTAIDRGAELLLIVHRAPAVSDGNGGGDGASDAAFLQSLFPEGSQDLCLDMKRDLFLLGNNTPGGGRGTEAGIRDALKKLVFQWNMQGEKRFYWVNVLRQQQRIGYYRYNDWFPPGADDKTVQNLWDREQEDRHAWERLEKARRQVGESAGEEELIEVEEELRTQELLEQAADEAGRENLLRAAPLRKSLALKDSRNMDKLRQALTARALELYEDQDRLCAPIEAELLRAVRDLAEDCRRKIGEKTGRIKEEFAGIPDERLRSRELTRLREQDKALSSSIDQLARAADWLEQKVRGFAQEMEQAEKKYQEWENSNEISVKNGPFLNYALESGTSDIPTKEKIVKSGAWQEQILKPVKLEYIRRRNRVRAGLAYGALPLPEGWVSPEQRAHRLNEILRGLDQLLPEQTGLNSCRLPDRLLHPGRAEILAAIGGEKALQDEARELEKELFQSFSQREKALKEGKQILGEAVGWFGGAVVTLLLGPAGPAAGVATKRAISSALSSGSLSTEQIVTWGLGRSVEGIWKEVQTFIRYQRDNTAEQLKVLHKIEHELCKKGEDLRKNRRDIRGDLATTAAHVRAVLLDRQLKEELAPLEQELKRWDELSRTKNWMEVSL